MSLEVGPQNDHHVERQMQTPSPGGHDALQSYRMERTPPAEGQKVQTALLKDGQLHFPPLSELTGDTANRPINGGHQGGGHHGGEHHGGEHHGGGHHNGEHHGGGHHGGGYHNGEHHNGEHHNGEHHNGEHHNGEHHNGEHHNGGHHGGGHHGGEHHSGEHHSGEHHSGGHHNGEHHNGEHHNGEHHNGEHHNGEHHNGEHHNGEHHNGEHHNGEHHNGEHHKDKDQEGRQDPKGDKSQTPEKDKTQPEKGEHNLLKDMVNVVKNVAHELGLTKNATVAAVAAMIQESGGDPNKPGDYGKRDHQPHSFGLFQVNFRGGEGTEAGITPKQALDPHTNARIAMHYFKEHQHHGDPATIAMKAQRASDPNYYHNVKRYVHLAERLLDGQ